MAFQRAIKAVVFDMDGLLFDTERLYLRAMEAEAAAIGQTLPADLLNQLVGATWAGSMALLASRFGEGFEPERFQAQTIARMHALAEAEGGLKAGVLEILQELDVQGLPRAICTSSYRWEVDHHLASHSLTDRFDAIVAHGDYARGKPNPDPYLRAADVLGVAPADCLALEDSHNGVRAAAAAGMTTIMVPDLLAPTDEVRALCHSIAVDLHAVRGLLAAQPSSG